MQAASNVLLTTDIAASIFGSIWHVISDNFAGVAVLLGLIAGVQVAARLINGAKKGKVRV